MSDDSSPHLAGTLESLMRITLAGFGGALAGISISRRGGASSAQTVAKSTSNVIQQSLSRKQRRQAIRSAPPVLGPSVDRELPSAWAVACMAFAGVVEFTRLASPTTFVWQFITTDDSQDDSESKDDQALASNNPEVIKFGSTVVDYMIGGSIAGALFKGSRIRTAMGARIDASMLGNYATSSALKGSPLSGIFPGAALGLAAGVSIVAMEYAQVAIEENFGAEDDEHEVIDSDTTEVAPRNKNDDIPADIKAMTSEELAASIQNLRSGRVESSESNNQEEEDEPHEEEAKDNEVVDLLYAIGFRPHQS